LTIFALHTTIPNMVYKSNQISIHTTVLWDGKYWMALFERRDLGGYSVAKATISIKEPDQYQISKFLVNLDRYKLQFTEPGQEPVTTRLVVVEKKLKYETKHLEEVQLKNIHGDAKNLLHKQKLHNRILRKEKENAQNKDQKDIKNSNLFEKKIQKHKGR
jgi:hypothetical protein